MPIIEKVLIVGGGVAGLSTALALGRIEIHCDVLETADAPLGASLGISGRAADALAELGVYEACAAEATVWDETSEAGSMRDAAGQVIAKGPERPQWPGAHHALGVYRPVLARRLAEAAEAAGARVLAGVTADRIERLANGCLAFLTNGETGRYDLVIGADGVWSTTRQQLFPDVPAPQYAGQMSIRWMAPGPRVAGEGMHVSPEGRVGFYYLPQDLVYVPAVIGAPRPIRPSKPELYALFDRLLAAFSAPSIQELRRRLTPESEIICRPFEWLLVRDPWRDGVLLIGDAAHATTAHMGMGGGMAIEDAVVLAQCLASGPSLEASVAAFKARRFNRVRTVVETSVAISQGEQMGAPASERIRLQTEALRTLAEAY